jgi:hypothetical protein
MLHVSTFLFRSYSSNTQCFDTVHGLTLLVWRSSWTYAICLTQFMNLRYLFDADLRYWFDTVHGLTLLVWRSSWTYAIGLTQTYAIGLTQFMNIRYLFDADLRYWFDAVHGLTLLVCVLPEYYCCVDCPIWKYVPSILYSLQTVTGAHLVSYPVGTGGFVPEDNTVVH